MYVWAIGLLIGIVLAGVVLIKGTNVPGRGK